LSKIYIKASNDEVFMVDVGEVGNKPTPIELLKLDFKIDNNKYKPYSECPTFVS
jgi:hypothetical protein